MEKFNRTLRGYDPDEVNKFLDQVIKQVEGMVEEIKVKNQKINELSKLEDENKVLKEKLSFLERNEDTLNKAIFMAQKTSDQMKLSAHSEAEAIISDAKKNANRIINEALLEAEKAEREAANLRRNINIFKRRLRDIIEAQLEVVKEMDHVEL